LRKLRPVRVSRVEKGAGPREDLLVPIHFDVPLEIHPSLDRDRFVCEHNNLRMVVCNPSLIADIPPVFAGIQISSPGQAARLPGQGYPGRRQVAPVST
jgi:hypothetical protein